MQTLQTKEVQKHAYIYIYIQILFINLLLKVENFGQGNNEVELEEDTCVGSLFVVRMDVGD